MAAVPEDGELWEDLEVSSAKYLDEWFRAVPPLWSCRPSHLIATAVPDKVERTVKIFESLLLCIASAGERSGGRPDDSVPTRMFRIAGLFQEYG
eukprot:12474867-Alexandrium_andersonii.AAC.1